MRVRFSACFCLIANFAGFGTVSAAPLCPGLSGQARSNCLRAEQNRTAATASRDNAYLASLNRSMDQSCKAVEAADFAAQILAEGKEANVMWAGRTWMTARALADASMGQRQECQRLRREMGRR